MATNKIYFNNTTTPVTLNGIYWNGSKIEGCKGIKLNGDIVVSFETAPGPFQSLTNNINWELYVDEYDGIWTGGNIDENINAIIKKTAQNECAIARTKWVTLIRKDLNTDQLFNFNGDARIFMSEDTSAAWNALQNKTTTIVTDLKDLYIGKNSGYSKGWLTGLPIVYKTLEGYAGTSVIDGDINRITFDGNYEITFTRVAGGLTMSDMLDEIKTQLLEYGINSNVPPGDNTILFEDNDFCKPSEMGMQEILNILSNIYIPNAGPFVYQSGTSPEPHELIPRSNFDFNYQTYWSASLSNVYLRFYTFQEAAEDGETSPDIYIATGLDGEKITNLDSYTESTDSQSNPYNIIWYFTASCSDRTYSLAECRFPNALSEFSYVYNSEIDPTDPNTGVMKNWVGLDTSITRGGGLANSVFPDDQIYSQLTTEIQAGYPYPEYNSFFPGGQTFIQANEFENVKFEFVYDDTEGYAEGYAVFDFYAPNFPYNLPSNPSETKQFKIGLRRREYPCVVNAESRNINGKWYANGFDDVCNKYQAYPIGAWDGGIPSSYATYIPVEYFI